MSAAAPIPKLAVNTSSAASTGSDDSPHRKETEDDHTSSHYAHTQGAVASLAAASNPITVPASRTKPIEIPTNSASQNRSVSDFTAVPTDTKKIGVPMSPLSGSSSPLYRRRRSNADQSVASPRGTSVFGFGAVASSPRNSYTAGMLPPAIGAGSLGKSSNSVLAAAGAGSGGAEPSPKHAPGSNGSTGSNGSGGGGGAPISGGFALAKANAAAAAAAAAASATGNSNGSGSPTAAAGGSVVVPAAAKLLKPAAPKGVSSLSSPAFAAAVASAASAPSKSSTDILTDSASPRIPATPSPSPLPQPHIALTTAAAASSPDHTASFGSTLTVPSAQH